MSFGSARYSRRHPAPELGKLTPEMMKAISLVARPDKLNLWIKRCYLPRNRILGQTNGRGADKPHPVYVALTAGTLRV